MFVVCDVFVVGLFFFKQKTAYEMRISDWSSDVCSSDLNPKAYAAISDLATASSFRNGKIETDGGPYRVDSDPEAPSLMLVSKGLKRRKEGQEAFNIGTREIPSLIDDENKMQIGRAHV